MHVGHGTRKPAARPITALDRARVRQGRLDLEWPGRHKTRRRWSRRWTVSLGDTSYAAGAGRAPVNGRPSRLSGAHRCYSIYYGELWPTNGWCQRIRCRRGEAHINSIRTAFETQFRHATCSRAATATRDVVRIHGTRPTAVVLYGCTRYLHCLTYTSSTCIPMILRHKLDWHPNWNSMRIS